MINPAEEIKYKTKNILLEHPADWYIQKDTFNAVEESIPSIVDFYEKEGEKAPVKNNLHKIIKEPLKDVYTAPFFSEKFCEILLDEVKSLENYLSYLKKTKSKYLL